MRGDTESKRIYYKEIKSQETLCDGEIFHIEFFFTFLKVILRSRERKRKVCLKKDGALKKGSDLSKVCKDSSYVLAAWDPDSSWEIGDKITVEGEELEIAGLLNYDPFSSDGLTHGKLTLIMSGETFVRLTGIADYSLVLIQTVRNAPEEQVEAIRRAAGDGLEFQDLREQRTTGTYTAFVGCVYGFLAIITLVAVLNIVNSISMSVTARIRQYGAMRAVGMDGYQVTKMIAAEAFTYAFCGCLYACQKNTGAFGDRDDQ